MTFAAESEYRRIRSAGSDSHATYLNHERLMNEGVSCLCLTYGRPALLEEAVESFLRQRWPGGKELLVLNDHPEQQLRFDHPEVRVVNLPLRLPTLGAKRNISVALARFENLLVWDDDDIHLPWRIEETMRVLPRQGYFKCPEVWLMRGAELRGRGSDGALFNHGACAYTKRRFERAGGYRGFNGGEDQDFELRLWRDPAFGHLCRMTPLPPARLYYIRRWNHGSYHASGCASLDGLAPRVAAGVHHLRPHWKADYCGQVRRHVRHAAPRPRPAGEALRAAPPQEL